MYPSTYRYKLSLLVVGGLLFTIAALAQKGPQPTLQYRSVKPLTVGGLTFKDLNKNGKLDPYEDWRLPVAARVANLLSQMTLEEKVGFMLINTARMGGDNALLANASRTPITSSLNKADLVQPINMFTRKPLPTPTMSAAGTTKGVMQ